MRYLAFAIASLAALPAFGQGRMGGGSRFGDLALTCDVCLQLSGGTMTGDLDLDGNKLILDVDGDTYVSSPGDDQVRFTIGTTDKTLLITSFFYPNLNVRLTGQYMYDSTQALAIGGACAAAGSSGEVCTAGDLDVGNDLVAAGSITNTVANGSTGLKDGNMEVLTFAANPGDASKTTSSLIPDGAVLNAMTTRVTTTGTNCTSIDIGDGTDVDLYGAGIAVTAGTTTTNADATASFAKPLLAASDVTVTANGGNCFDLVIRIVPHYDTYTAPTD